MPSNLYKTKVTRILAVQLHSTPKESLDYLKAPLSTGIMQSADLALVDCLWVCSTVKQLIHLQDMDMI